MSKGKSKVTFQKHMMTGVSYMIPVIAMGGLLQAIGTMIGGPGVAKATGSLAGVIYTAGKTEMTLVVPVLAAFIAYSIADRPGIAPGLLVGSLAVANNTGFLGGIIGGYFIGYLAKLIKDKMKVPAPMQPLMSVLIIPFLAGIIGALAMKFIVGPPIGAFVTWGTKAFKSMGIQSKFLFGAILGALVGIDMAGPIGKIGTTVANGMMADGIFEPEGAKVCCCMVPPLALGLSSVFFSKKKYNRQEQAAGKSAIMLGLFQVTEGGLPFLLSDPVHVIPCTVIGAAVAGGLSMVFGVTSPVTMGGIVAMPVMGNALEAIISVLAGVIVCVALLAVFKKNKADEEVHEEELDTDIEFKME